MKLQFLTLATALGLAALAAGPVSAAALNPTSYDMANGDGNASGGTYNYWDVTYTGAGAKTTDHAPLSGGLGVLTDGYASPDPWYNVSNGAGTGPYVGWEFRQHGEPTITFHFAGTKTFNTVSVAVDNTGIGGVSAPTVLVIDGTTYTPTVTAFSPTSEWLTVSGLSLSGNSLTLTPDGNPNSWTFISEVTFGGVSGVPEPAAWTLMLLGVGGLGAALRARRSATAVG